MGLSLRVKRKLTRLFRNRSKRKDETYIELGHTLRRLATRAFPCLSHDAHETMVLEQFLMGLQGADMRKHVRLAHPKGLDGAVMLTTEYENICGAQQWLIVNRWGASCEDHTVESELCGGHSCLHVFLSFLKFGPSSMSGKKMDGT